MAILKTTVGAPVPMPMIEIQAETSASKLTMLVDSGSTYSLISSAVAEILMKTSDAREVDTCFEMPAIRVANGMSMTATKRISLRLAFGNDATADVQFFCLRWSAIGCYNWKRCLPRVEGSAVMGGPHMEYCG